MANGADFKVNIVGDAKALLKEMEKTSKASKKSLQEHAKLDGKYQKAKKRELASQSRLDAGRVRDQKKHLADLGRADKKRWSEKDVQYRKEKRQIKRDRQESQRYQKSEDRAMAKRQNRGGRAVRAGIGLGASIGGFIVGGAVSSYGKHLQVEKAKAGLIGMGSARSINKSLRAGGASRGFNYAEDAQHAKMMGRASGYTGPKEMQQMMRSTGMEAGEVAGMVGNLTKSGVSFDPSSGSGSGKYQGASAGGSMLAKIMAAGIHKGFQKSRFPEFVAGMNALVKQQGGSIAGAVDPLQSAKMLGMFSRAGEKNNLPGFMGERGAAMAGKLQNAFYKPGGGDWGQGLFQRAMGFGVQGSGETHYTALKKQQRGLTGDNLRALLGQVGKEHGFGEKGSYAVSKVAPGISLDYAEKMLKMYERGELTDEEVEKAVKKAVPIEQQSLTAMEEMGGTIARLAVRFNKFADAGEIFQEAIEAVQDAQLKLFQFLVEKFKEWSPFVKEMASGIKMIAEDIHEYFHGNEGESSKGEAAKAATAERLAREEYGNATTAKGKRIAAAKVLAATNTQAHETMGGGMSWLDKGWTGVKAFATLGGSVQDMVKEKGRMNFRTRMALGDYADDGTSYRRAGWAEKFQDSMPTDSSMLLSDHPGMGAGSYEGKTLPDMRLPENQERAIDNYLRRKYGGKEGMEYSVKAAEELSLIRKALTANKPFGGDANAEPTNVINVVGTPP